MRTTGGPALGPTGRWPGDFSSLRGSENQTLLTAHGMGGEAKVEMAIWRLSEIQSCEGFIMKLSVDSFDQSACYGAHGCVPGSVPGSRKSR